MAIKIALADPRTLDAAFIAQAHRTEGLCQRSSRLSPVGKGMPIAKPAGAIARAVTNILAGSGHVMAALLNQGARNARIVTRPAIVTSTFANLRSSVPTTLLL